ncbi:MAG: hypothetical protein LBJ64_10360 [Deltaproteobacteria bacterium]|jgi:hypothetical protein|nr:hypothetical protein [Deltaproteobacteria bacterium]
MSIRGARTVPSLRPDLLFKTAFFLTVLALCSGFAFISVLWAQPKSDRQHIVYFQGTPQELEIYKIYGRHEGPTIMVLGGIQGDEPGGFLSADLYVDMALKRGNLIVVPRANFKSIIQSDRGSDGDMNRKFADVKDMDPDRDRIEIIKNLMAESDVFLNLHDGSGFFRPVWESEMANPLRYGQCIIADAEVYTNPETGRVIQLGRDARKAIDIINQDIQEERYKFNFSNHDTMKDSSKHLEQRKSASYYALTKLGIPAFGIETSKQLPSLEMKIHQHNLAVNAFMEIYGVVPEQPRINLSPPVLQYLVISVNGQLPVAVADGQTLMLSPGDVIEVVHVGANYDRGLSVDILGAGSLNDIRMPLAVNAPTRIIARKDNHTFGQIDLAFLPPDSGKPSPQLMAATHVSVVEAGAGWLPGSGPPPEAVRPRANQPATSAPAESTAASASGSAVAVTADSSGSGSSASAQAGVSQLPEMGKAPGLSMVGSLSGPLSAPEDARLAGGGSTAEGPSAGSLTATNGVTGFILEVDGQHMVLRPQEILSVRRGAKIKLVDIETTVVLPADAVYNLRGFIGKAGDVRGDDKGAVADTAADMIPRFVQTREGRQVYQLGAEHGPKLLAAAYVEIVPIKLHSVVFQANGQEKTLRLGQRWGLAPGTPFVVKEVVLEGDLLLNNPRFTLGGRSFSPLLPQTLTMPNIAVSLAVFDDKELAGKVVLFPQKK